MQIEVRLFATLRENRWKNRMLDAAEGTSVMDLMTNLEIDPSDIAILLINGRDGEMDHILIEGDILSVFPPVGGG